MSEQYGFRITAEIIEQGTFAEARASAMRTANQIAEATGGGAYIVLTETGESLLSGPIGTFCEGCDGNAFEGIRWPTAINNDTSREWIERCDECERYESDEAAAEALSEIYEGNVSEYGKAKPRGLDALHPYLSTD